jgi:arginyl-tRNA synthetase
MKQLLEQLVKQALQSLKDSGQFTLDIPEHILIERPRETMHGDYATNIALILAKAMKTNPKTLAQLITDALPTSLNIKKTEIAGPGFINFFVAQEAEHQIIPDILKAGQSFGHSDIGQNKKVIVEFVSTNPTGPLHVGHGRHAAYGASLSNLLEAIGYNVHREYYINDAGRQMDIVAISVWLRYLEKLGETITFPTKGYQGEYIKDIVQILIDQYGDRFKRLAKDVYKDLPEDDTSGTSENQAEKHIDALIERAQMLLADDFDLINQLGLDSILRDIREDLDEFGVTFDEWFSEKSLRDSGAAQKSLDVLRAKHFLYEKDGAVWFRSTQFGDSDDHVVVRSNGSYTYLTPDIAYHWNKIDRGFEIIIDPLGADHHGYIPRLRAAIQALGLKPEAVHIPLVQFVTLYRGKEQVKMSTRKASFVTLRQLREEVGNDAVKFFYVMRKNDQHMDFDLDLAKSQSSDNPLYYIQYAHARICSVFRQLAERNLQYDQDAGLNALNRLTTEHEQALIKQLSRYAEIIMQSAQNLEPHRLANYLRDLATDFHAYYNSEQFIVENDVLRNARLCLINATRQIISNGLNLLGVSAPEVM